MQNECDNSQNEQEMDRSADDMESGHSRNPCHKQEQTDQSENVIHANRASMPITKVGASAAWAAKNENRGQAAFISARVLTITPRYSRANSSIRS